MYIYNTYDPNIMEDLAPRWSALNASAWVNCPWRTVASVRHSDHSGCGGKKIHKPYIALGIYSDLMVIYSDSMGFYSDSMGCYWEIPSGKLT